MHARAGPSPGISGQAGPGRPGWASHGQVSTNLRSPPARPTAPRATARLSSDMAARGGEARKVGRGRGRGRGTAAGEHSEGVNRRRRSGRQQAQKAALRAARYARSPLIVPVFTLQSPHEFVITINSTLLMCLSS
jgi:hypothetical protein